MHKVTQRETAEADQAHSAAAISGVTGAAARTNACFAHPLLPVVGGWWAGVILWTHCSSATPHACFVCACVQATGQVSPSGPINTAA